MSKKIFGVVVILFVITFFLNSKTIIKVFYPRQYKEFVESVSSTYGLDSNLVYSLIKIESKFDPYAKSSKNAAGLMQITPQTAEYIAGLLGDRAYKSDDMFEPKTNIRFGCFYFNKLLRDFDGNLNCALAAYNGGEGNVRKWMSIDEFGKRTLSTDNIPYNETKKYVILVKKNYSIYSKLYSNTASNTFKSNLKLLKDVLTN